MTTKQNRQSISRRNFLKSGIISAPAIFGISALSAAETTKTPEQKKGQFTGKHPIRIGGPLFTKETDPEKWMQVARAQGYRAVYAPGKLSVDDLVTVHAWRDAAKAHDILFAEVGCWCNPMDPDPEKRKVNMDRLVKSLALAEELDAKCAVDIAGSINRTSWFGPAKENISEGFFETAVENARKIIDAVKPKRTKFAYEAMGWAVPDSPDCYLRLLKAIDRDAFGVHLDICNMVNSPTKYWHNADLINESFDKLGPWVVSCHAKDLRWEIEMNIHFVECVIGQGVIDYETYLKRLSTLPNDVPLMIEHMKGQKEYEQSRDRIYEVGAKVNVPHEYLR